VAEVKLSPPVMVGEPLLCRVVEGHEDWPLGCHAGAPGRSGGTLRCVEDDCPLELDERLTVSGTWSAGGIGLLCDRDRPDVGVRIGIAVTGDVVNTSLPGQCIVSVWGSPQ